MNIIGRAILGFAIMLILKTIEADMPGAELWMWVFILFGGISTSNN